MPTEDTTNTDLIILKNSNPLNKYPVDADELNHNFRVLALQQGQAAVQQIIESSGQVYTPIIDNQLAIAVAQYVFSCTLMDDKGTGNTYKLYPRDGFSAPYRYTYGMEVSFIPSRTNTGPMTLQIENLAAYPVLSSGNPVPAGFLSLNAITTFRFYGTYWQQVTYGGGGSSSSGTGGSESDTSTSTLYNQIREVVVSAGMGFDQTDTTLLSKAIAQYVARSVFSAVYEDATYKLTPFGDQYAPEAYTDGMLVAFTAPETNQYANPNITIGSLMPIELRDYNSASLEENAISAGEFVLCQYVASDSAPYFIMLSQHKEALSLANGYKVSSISNDGALTEASQTALPTEYAVKTYIDNKVQATKENLIISGYGSENTAATASVVFSGNPANNSTLTVGTTTYKFVSALADANDVLIASSVSETIENLAAAINATPSGEGTQYGEGTVANAQVTASIDEISAGSTIILTAKTAGYSGNYIPISTSSIAITLPGAFLTGGLDAVNSIRAIGSHTIQLVAGSDNAGIVEYTPDTTDRIIVSGNDALKINAVSKAPEVYWESEKSGYAVDDVSRVLSGSPGSYYVTTETTLEGDVVYLHNPPAYCYYGFTGLTGVYNRLKIKHTDSNHTPQQLRVYVNTSPTLGETLWMPLCTPSTENATLPSYTYGNIASLETDDEGYYTLELPPYVLNGSTIQVFNPTSTYALRVVPYTFNQQFATTETLNSEGYDPNNDNDPSTTKYTWQIQNIVLGKSVDSIAPFVISYPSGTLENITTPVYYTQYYNTGSSENSVSLYALSNSSYVLYKQLNVAALSTTSASLVFVQTTEPEAIEANSGAVWMDVSTIPYTTYILSSTQTAEGARYFWNPADIILLGAFTVDGNNNISSLTEYRKGDTLITEFDMNLDEYGAITRTIEHNFGSDVTVECFLVCTAANNTYEVGESILLDYNTDSQTTGATLTETAVNLTKQLSYFLVSNTSTKTRFDAYHLQIINRNTHALVALPNNSWKLRVYISKD